MVVLMVTLYLRVSMRRSTGFSTYFSLLKSGFAAALALATILSCSDSMSKVAFTPEAIPNIAPFPLKDDGIILDKDVQFGFNFSFQGKTYTGVNIYMNGFLLFGPVPSLTAGYSDAQSIPAQLNPNNILALAWTDWSPQLVPDAIRFETRGSAPNRRWVFQYNNVPEYFSASKPGAIVANAGRLMTQLVLYEGSNDIVIYTNRMNVTNSRHFVTQGIENATGTDATFETVTNAAGVVSPRVKNFFNLDNDAVRFSLVSTKDEVVPSITAPSNVSKGNDPGLASAVVAVGSPVASDNCSDVTVTSVRSDAAAIDAPYPVGLTTITWTATDAAGNKASATQTVEVLDIEAPVFGPSAQSVLTVNATSPSGAVVNYSVNVTDNVKVTSLSCEPASGSVFSAGSHDVSCTASDAAGNSSSMSFSVLVIGAREQIEMLIHDVADLPLKNGAANPLINQLRAALNENGNECKKVSDFIDMVSKKVTNASDAATLIQAARDIMGALGCEVPASKAARVSNLRVTEFARPKN